MLVKHNDIMTANMCISVVWGEKKKKKKKKINPALPTHFFSRHVTVNTTLFWPKELIKISCIVAKCWKIAFYLQVDQTQ